MQGYNAEYVDSVTYFDVILPDFGRILHLWFYASFTAFLTFNKALNKHFCAVFKQHQGIYIIKK